VKPTTHDNYNILNRFIQIPTQTRQLPIYLQYLKDYHVIINFTISKKLTDIPLYSLWHMIGYHLLLSKCC